MGTAQHYGFSRGSGLQNIHLEDQLTSSQAFERAEGSLDFADALHLASGQDARSFATFDDKRAKRVTGIDVAAI